jgi:hypothetical protein
LRPFIANFAALLAVLGLAPSTLASDAGHLDKATAEKVHPSKPPYSPYAGRNFPTQAYFGDTHLHTSFSMDAGAFGARLDPREAYRFARGEQVTSSTGQPVKLSRPLDFLVVADHSDNMGFFPDLFAGKPALLADPTGRKWYDMIKGGKGADAALEIIVAFSHNKFPKDLMYFPGTTNYKGAWQQTIKAVDEFNEPGRFTAFIGFEWTSNTGGNNLHRNVIFRDNGDKASRVEPFTVYPPYGSDDPANLWKWMAEYEAKTGGNVLAIAHNGNLSSGLMFPMVEAFGKKLDRNYVETRAKWERLYETTQTKGTGESHPFLSPNDEFAAFEIWDKGNLVGSVKKKNEMLEFEYARGALKNGLKLEQALGTNPYKFGLIGSSDALALGQERDDIVIRRRLRQKFEFLAESEIDATPPTERELRACLEAHAEQFKSEPELAFQQVYFKTPDRARAALASGKDPAHLGDPLMLPAEVALAPRSSIARQFGSQFAQEIEKLPAGRWAGPVASGFGAHLVRVTEHEPGRAPDLAEVRALVEREFLAARRKKELDALYERLLARYKVVIQ